MESRRKKVSLMDTVRFVHEDDINLSSFETMIDTLNEKIYCQYRIGDEIKDAFISRNLDGFTEIKFAYDLLGKLYEPNPWNSTRDFRAKDELLIIPEPIYE